MALEESTFTILPLNASPIKPAVPNDGSCFTYALIEGGGVQLHYYVGTEFKRVRKRLSKLNNKPKAAFTRPLAMAEMFFETMAEWMRTPKTERAHRAYLDRVLEGIEWLIMNTFDQNDRGVIGRLVQARMRHAKGELN